MALTATSSVGRLVELRFIGDPTLEEVVQFERDTQAYIGSSARSSGRPVVICTDARSTPILRPDVSERLVRLMMRSNSRSVERNGVLGGSSALAQMQGVRILRKAEAEPDVRRRMFSEPDALLAWLDELLDLRERARLRAFLAEHEPTGLPGTAFVATALEPPPPRPRRRGT